eukprot:comp65571_c0_seq1/m.48001 comp65571_c0_seq1/g.48001  ORF comp65571_c0_seq1/g.48001 comp65571_c0_seq1/m.48001 type:complete len:402 (-) comp65571_c0_seq1:75-1280(-)
MANNADAAAAQHLQQLKARSAKRRLYLLNQKVDVRRFARSNQDKQEEKDVKLPSVSALGLEGSRVEAEKQGLNLSLADTLDPKLNKHMNLQDHSTVYLKGTITGNPHNDWTQHYVDTGERPCNYVRNVDEESRLDGQPKYRRLVKAKEKMVADTAPPAMFLHCDLHTFDLTSLGAKFDVAIIEPPLPEHGAQAPGLVNDTWDWAEVGNLPISQIMDTQSVIFLWVGCSEGLEEGRLLLMQWGFKRSEELCWIKTNKARRGVMGQTVPSEDQSVMYRIKEHCLVGMRGGLQRSTDTDFVHANIDTDVIIAEEPPLGCLDKPEEQFGIMERFCLGLRRLHLFGSDATIRRGWVTVGPRVTKSNWSEERYLEYFKKRNVERGKEFRVGFNAEVDSLRPRTPPPK